MLAWPASSRTSSIDAPGSCARRRPRFVIQVRRPLWELARQVADELGQQRRHRPAVIAAAATGAGVPVAYVLDEFERRTREAG